MTISKFDGIKFYLLLNLPATKLVRDWRWRISSKLSHFQHVRDVFSIWKWQRINQLNNRAFKLASIQFFRISTFWSTCNQRIMRNVHHKFKLFWHLVYVKSPYIWQIYSLRRTRTLLFQSIKLCWILHHVPLLHLCFLLYQRNLQNHPNYPLLAHVLR